jgi:type II secretion system (T2SS) protein M
MKSLTAGMSQREKVLAGAVGGVAFVLLNLFLLSYFFRQQARVRADLVTKNADWTIAEVLLSERDLWAKRDAWLHEKQPKLTNESGAGVELLEEIKKAAKAADVQIESPAIGIPQKGPTYRSVPVTLETKSSWKAMIEFLHAIQKPEQFIVFENANIQIDPNDQTQMRGKLKIARWYSAEGK